MEIIGVIGAICLGICGLPQTIYVIKSKNADGVSSLFLFLWGLGEILMSIYVIYTIYDLILLLNYLFNLILVSVIIHVKFTSRSKFD